MRLHEAGEFGLIDRLRRVLDARGAAPGDVAGATPGARRRPAGPRLALGIGDDAAIWEQDAAALVATTDLLVEDVHFDLHLTTWHDLGWKALAVNLSDIAAMGAAPTLAFVSIGLRGQATVEDVEALYEGMQRLAVQSGCTVAGGDTVGSPAATVINVTLLGQVPRRERESLLRRDRGRPGDLVAVTGTLGASAAGLYALQHPAAADGAAPRALVEAHLRPTPQLTAGTLLRQSGVRCAMDISDGLLADLAKLCAASGTGAVVRAPALPLSMDAMALYPEQALEWAAGGGEDYQLLFAAPSSVMRPALDAVRAAGVAATEIGSLVDGGGVHLVDASGADMQVRARGWDHFMEHA